jgi:hypothetical protein
VDTTDNQKIRARLTAIIAEIERARLELGERYVSDPGDREAHEIVQRIERKLKRKRRGA